MPHKPIDEPFLLMQTKCVADDLGQDHPGTGSEDRLQEQHLAPSPLWRGFL